MTPQQRDKFPQRERRRDRGRRATVLGWALGLAGAVIVVFLVCLLVYG